MAAHLGDGERPPEVSVVVPARNEAATIAACLDSILAQTFGDLEVLVVDGNSSDETAAIVLGYAERDPRIRLLSNPEGIIPVSLNLALAQARGTWLVRVDAHSRIDPSYVTSLVDHLRTGQWGGVGGRKDGVGRTPAGVAIAAALGSRFGVGDSHYHHAVEPREVDHVPFGAYPVAICREIGGWDSAITTNEDYEFDYRLRAAGHRLLLDPSIRIEWVSRQSIRDLLAQYWRYGVGKAAVARLHPDSLQARHLAPPLLVANLGAAAVVAMWRPRLAALLLAPYAAVVTAGSVSASRQLERGARRYLPAALIAMHVGWGAGFWRGVVMVGRRSRRPPAANG
jgi:glycosyltransferase involved in cell wall biosynthesis